MVIVFIALAFYPLREGVYPVLHGPVESDLEFFKLFFCEEYVFKCSVGIFRRLFFF